MNDAARATTRPAGESMPAALRAGLERAPSPAGRTSAIVARNVVKRYPRDAVLALAGFDMRVEEGEFVAIRGPSGCGKSTLLNLVAGIDRPDEGELIVLGRSPGLMDDAEASRFRAVEMGMVFQLHHLLPHLTALENVQVPMFGVIRPHESPADRARELLSRVGLAPRMNARPPNLSGGERQRVAIARALANRPRLLLADEPTGALDSRTGEQLFDLLGGLREDLGMTLVVVTHDREVAARADRLIEMRDGRLAECA